MTKSLFKNSLIATALLASIIQILLISMAQAGLISQPLPSKQASILPQSQAIANDPQNGTVFYPLPAENSTTTRTVALVQPVTSQPTITPNLPTIDSPLTRIPSGQEYYTIPNKPDDFAPLPVNDMTQVQNDPSDFSNIEPMPILPKKSISVSQKTSKPLAKTPIVAKTTKTTNQTSIPISTKKTTIPNTKSSKTATPNETRPQIIPKKPVNEPSPKEPAKQTTKQPPVQQKIVPTAKADTLKFANFPAKVYTGKRVTPKISTLKALNGFYVEALHGSKGEKQFIDTLSKSQPNYAGHYVITSFSCGLNCSASVAYDVKTGEFMELGGGFADCPATDFNPRQKTSVTHQVNSRLMIVIGSSATGSCVAGYFEEKNGNVNLISQKNLMTYVDMR